MKTRSITRERLVPHTVDGKTRMVPDDVTIEIPAPPRDLDRIALNVVTGIVGIALLACVGFSTASIGDLLSRVVHEAAAYGAAIVFDLAWIACTIIEWLARYTPDRAKKARAGGYVALAVAMGAIGAHGWLAGDAATGIVGAVVSGLAKGLWAVLLDYQAVPLDKRTAAFLQQELGEAAVELSRIPVERRVNRARALREAERRALEAESGSADPDQSGPDPQSGSADPLPTLTGPMTVKDAVRTATDSGITAPDAVLRYVHTVADANAKPDTVNRYLRGA